MLSQGDILERIHSGRTKLIRKVVRVQFEPRIQLPIDFWFQGLHHEILEVIFSKRHNRFCSEFLVRTDRGIYNLKSFYLEVNIPKFQLKFNGWWKIDFKVLE